MRKLILVIMFPIAALASGGDDHDHGKAETANGNIKTYFSSEAVSDKYELFLKYDPIVAGDETILRLFVSEFLTNKPLDSASITVQSKEDKSLKFVVSRI